MDVFEVNCYVLNILVLEGA